MIHARPDYNRIQDPAGLIPEDMPVFLLVGKDKHAAATVRFWADQVEAGGGDPEMVRIARNHADLMDALPEHKAPDLPSSHPPFIYAIFDDFGYYAKAPEHDEVRISPWVDAGNGAIMRYFVGTDERDVANRVAFIEKTPRVRIAPFSKSDDHLNWRQGPKGSSSQKHSQESRVWCDQQLKQLNPRFVLLGEQDQLCGCRTCLRNRGEEVHGIPKEMTQLVVCSVCGNKRCPHATDHRLACTNSNEPGQPGSHYA